MDKKVLALIILIVGVLVIVGGVVLFGGSEEPVEVNEQTSQQEEDGITEIETVSFTTEEVAAHSTEDDCWTIIGGSVYDITTYIPRHPGGDEILRACGADGTVLFQTRTTEEGETVGSGTPHSNSAFSQLGPLFVGDFVD
jgi:Tfp pilus tip-associated adhesin PilY1